MKEDEDIIIVDPLLLSKKIQQIKEDGIENLHVVSDFDRTLTPCFVHGQRTASIIAQVREGNYLTPPYTSRLCALFDKYHPIKIAEDIPREIKNKKMHDWWLERLNLIIKSGMNKKIIDDIIQKKKVQYRKGAKEFINSLTEHKIPLLIFSGSLGDIIEGSLKFEGIFHPNIHIISNFFQFDEKGNATGYRHDIIHIFNKNEGHIKKSSYYHQIQDRKNVILLGDGPGDSSMLEGLPHKTIIKIGFLNEHIEKQRNLFEKEFDIIILKDGAMDYVNDMMMKIF